jgi:transposase-like protein
MVRKLAHPERRHKHKKVDRLTRAERRARQLQRQAAWVEHWISVVQVFIAAVLKAEVADLLGRPVGKWGDRSEPVAVQASCNRCQRTWRSWFRRNGTYPRTLAIAGVVIDLRVPRVRCHCGGTVDLSFSVFAPYDRLSPEVEERLREAVALGLTLRQVGAVHGPANGGPLAKSTINTRILDVLGVASAFHAGPLPRVPAVVLVDGLWVRVFASTPETFVDATGRERLRVRRTKVGLLVAYGVDPTTGEWWVLDWERAEQEDQENWQRLIERLRQRGLTAENGLQLIVSDGSEGLQAALAWVDLGAGVKHQRCVFHKLRNVAQAVQGLRATNGETPEGKAAKEAKRQRRREVLQDAAAIYRGADRDEILRRRDAFVTTWQATEPAAVATLLRDFEQTIVYLDVQAAAARRGEPWDATYLRTSSALERLNRTLRRMVRQVMMFHSAVGLEVRVYLTLLQAGAILLPTGQNWSDVLEQQLAAA